MEEAAVTVVAAMVVGRGTVVVVVSAAVGMARASSVAMAAVKAAVANAVVGATEARAREEKLNMSLMQSMSRETLMIREVQLLQAELNEAAGWEAEVHRLREVVEELERGRLEEDEEFSRLAKALTEMQDGIQEERREREGKEEEGERERASMSAQVSSVKGVLLVELQVASSKDNSG